MPADYHSHTPLCRHAEGTPGEYVEAAVAAGLLEYGISDHAPTPEPFDDWRMAAEELPQYLDWIAEAREHAAGRLPVRAGLECDWLPGCGPWIEELAGRSDWDYLIGSVHYLGGDWDFDNPKWLGRWAETDVEEAWSRYWETYAAMASSGLFDILGHPDLIKKFGFRPGGDLARFYDPAVEAIAASGGAIELNTAGWHKPCGEQYPSAGFLRRAAAAGIPLVISSDAHAPGELGRDFDKGVALALESGFRETVLFAGRGRRVTALTAPRP
ncbi:MAG: histidinol-phosphatase [Akkermansiaceae bacterium]|nr:histidinol-phosphatase [Akkermansiaceae bacterium]NNM31308.1 histidinol-phosphatase [Akkermansiaceae bacterium]